MVVLAITLIAMLCLPAILVRYVCSDETSLRSEWLPGSWAHRLSRGLGLRRKDLHDGRRLRRLDRTWDGEPADPAPPHPAIEFLAADLRRLYRHRLGIATQSLVWHIAVLRAYDERLRLASRCLGVTEHLSTVTGMDLEIERLRIESELEAAGLVLRT